MTQDATDKASPELLRAQLDERSAIIDGALDGIVVIDDTGEVRDFNRAAQAMFGYTREEAVGAQIVDLIIPDVHRRSHQAGFDGYVNGTANAKMIGSRIETEARRKNGEVFPVELTIIETHGSGRTVFAGYLRDLTDRREMEAKVARQRDVIHQNEKLGSMGALLANVAHELNNPLSVVIGQAELLRERPLDQAVERHTSRILDAANRCSKIVHTFLAAARQKPPVRRTFSPDQPVTASARLVEHAFSSDGIELRIDIDAELPPLFGDDGQVGQVLANLLTNAQQALSGQSAPKRVNISVTRDGSGSNVVYSVSDNGPGIPETVRSRIFEPFFTTKEEGSGTGVGLAIVHNIASAHGGIVQADTCPELGGALFELRLPVNQAEESKPAQRNGSADATPADAPRVLVVDDDLDVGETVADLLALRGMNVAVTSSADDALAAMDTEQFDVILSDMRMPDLDGPAFYRAAVERWPGIENRFGFVTGDALNAVAAKFLRDVDAPVVEKPVTRENLMALVDKIRRRAAT